jgi:FkbM family methyltransferase
MHSDLIYDVGMHTGSDTEFYLRKGFRVVAIEANPRLAAEGRARFADAIAAGTLRLLNVAIHDHEGIATLFVNREKDVWSTVVTEVVRNKERLGTTFEAVDVPCRRFESILAEEGMPYYLKIDIEGVDTLCLAALHGFADRPKYVSIELSEEQPFQEICQLVALGYRQFKVLNQALNHTVRLPNPPREGVFVDARFDSHSSGPFGEETPRSWQEIEQALEEYRDVLARYRRDRVAAGRFGARIRWLYRRLMHTEPTGWHDLHARIGPP